MNVRIARWTSVLALAAALVLAACGGGDDDLDTVTLMLNWTPNNHHAGIYAALENGWYREAGIDLRIVEPAIAGADQVVAAGGADFGISQAESVLPARAAGAPVVSIATLLSYNDSSFMALAESGITRPRDFQGKTYGGFGGALERELLDTLIACDGGDPTLLQHIEVGNIDYLSGMRQGRFDFVWVFEGWDALRARDLEGQAIESVKFVDYIDCIPDWYTPVIIASESTLTGRGDLVRRFLDATARGYRLAIEDPELAATLLLRAAPELDEALVRASATYHASRYAAPGASWGAQSTDTWTRFEAFLRQAGLIEGPVDALAAFTNDYLPGQ